MKAKSRMLRIFVVALVVVFVLACLIGFAACGDDECEHEWDEGVVTKEATVDEEGEMTYTCTICGATKTEAIEKIIEKIKESVGLEFAMTSDGAGYAVTGIGTCTDKDIVIPAEHEGLPVVEIGNKAFDYCASIESVFIPASVTSIDEGEAFGYCSSLTTVTFEDGSKCESIGEAAFFSCTSLTSITIPDGVTTIEADTFALCTSLTSITIPENVANIGNSAFGDCTSLTTVYYSGTSAQWIQISIDSSNSLLTSATIYYYSESEPADSGNWWHYVNGEAVVWAVNS